MKKLTNSELRDKISEGTKLALHRLIEKKKREDGYLVFSENGKIVRLRARDMPSITK